jgi:peroxiredoxin
VKLAALLLGFATAASAVSIGDRVPSIDLDLGFPPERVNLASRTAGKKVILVGLPGAFTPT